MSPYPILDPESDIRIWSWNLTRLWGWVIWVNHLFSDEVALRRRGSYTGLDAITIAGTVLVEVTSLSFLLANAVNHANSVLITFRGSQQIEVVVPTQYPK